MSFPKIFFANCARALPAFRVSRSFCSRLSSPEMWGWDIELINLGNSTVWIILYVSNPLPSIFQCSAHAFQFTIKTQLTIYKNISRRFFNSSPVFAPFYLFSPIFYVSIFFCCAVQPSILCCWWWFCEFAKLISIFFFWSKACGEHLGGSFSWLKCAGRSFFIFYIHSAIFFGHAGRFW